MRTSGSSERASPSIRSLVPAARNLQTAAHAKVSLPRRPGTQIQFHCQEKPTAGTGRKLLKIAGRVLPWQQFAGMSDDDAQALWAFRQTLPAKPVGNR
jgi:hypothetical protein